MSPCSSDCIFTDKKLGVWHAVSEDSDYLGTWTALIHVLGNLDDFYQTLCSPMRSRLNAPQTFHELQEVISLGSSKRIPVEERDDRLDQITPASNAVPIQVHLVVVVSPIDVDIANPKVPLEHVQTPNAFRALCHRKLMGDLEPGLVTLSTCSMGLTDKVD